jgi:hypothetical protein
MLKMPDERSIPSPEDWGEATKLVRGGLDRSHHGETAEALYLNSGFVYPDAETAERRFAGEDDGFVYARYGNPTVSMFEERLRLLEGAEACYGVGSGMAAVWGALGLPAQCRRPHRVVAGAVRLVLPDHRHHPAALRHHLDAGGRPGPRSVEGRGAGRNQGVLSRDAVEPDAGDHRHRRGGRDRPCGGRAGGGRQRVRHAGAAEVPRARRRHHRLFGHQAYRRPGPGAGRRDHVDEGVQGRSAEAVFAPHRAVAVAVQRLGAAQGSGDAEARVLAQCEAALEIAGALQAMPGVARVIYPFLDGQPQGALGAPPDARRRHHGDLRGRGRQGPPSRCCGGCRSSTFPTISAIRSR